MLHSNEPYQRVSNNAYQSDYAGRRKGYYTNGVDSPLYGAIYDEIQTEDERKRRVAQSAVGLGVGSLAGASYGKIRGKGMFRGNKKGLAIGAGVGLVGGMLSPLSARTYEDEAMNQYQRALQSERYRR